MQYFLILLSLLFSGIFYCFIVLGRNKGITSGISVVQYELADFRARHDRQFEDLSTKLDMLLKTVSGPPRSPPGKGLAGFSESSSPHPPPLPHASNSSYRAPDGFHRPDFHPRKIELPVFTGEDADDWTYRAERYFSLQRLTPPEQLEVAVLCHRR